MIQCYDFFLRSAILAQIEEEDQQRKWYIAALDNIRQKLEQIPYSDGVRRIRHLYFALNLSCIDDIATFSVIETLHSF